MKVAVVITGQLRDYKINCQNHIEHLIKPNNADVFVYASTKNTIHTTGSGNQLTQKYILTNEYSSEEIVDGINQTYGSYVKNIVIDTEEKLPDNNFGTIAYFRQRMQNQIDNVGKGFNIAKKYSLDNNFKYDVIVRCRPDNSMFPKAVSLDKFDFPDNRIYSTVFQPSGHRDLCFFAAGNPVAFEKYCSFKYLENVDGNSTDGSLAGSTEYMWADYLHSIGVDTFFIENVCKPFTGFDKTLPVTDFPFRNKNELLIDSNGNFVKQVEP